MDYIQKKKKEWNKGLMWQRHPDEIWEWIENTLTNQREEYEAELKKYKKAVLDLSDKLLNHK